MLSFDLHQHRWPRPFRQALEARTRPPRIDGATLELAGGQRFGFADEEPPPPPGAAATSAPGPEPGVVCISVSAAWGIDRLAAAEADELAEAWLDAALGLGAPYRVWATAGIREPDPAGLERALARGAIGLEVAADVFAAPDGLDRLAPLLETLGDHPLFVHPGPAPASPGRPGWWTPTVDYVNDLHAAWWSWIDGGRERFPRLPVLFAALAGLGPLHGERQRARGGGRGGGGGGGGASMVDPLTFVETSSYGSQAVDATIRVLGIDVICRGSDHPYAAPAALDLDPSALRAIDHVNPARLLAPVLQELTA